MKIQTITTPTTINDVIWKLKSMYNNENFEGYADVDVEHSDTSGIFEDIYLKYALRVNTGDILRVENHKLKARFIADDLHIIEENNSKGHLVRETYHRSQATFQNIDQYITSVFEQMPDELMNLGISIPTRDYLQKGEIASFENPYIVISQEFKKGLFGKKLVQESTQFQVGVKFKKPIKYTSVHEHIETGHESSQASIAGTVFYFKIPAVLPVIAGVQRDEQFVLDRIYHKFN